MLPENRALPKKIKRKELTTYSANSIWTMQEHSIFLKYCPTVRMRAYHAIALDTSARPHELLKLKIKDLKERVIPAVKDRPECVIYQFLVKGKTGTRALALTNSMAYAKEWLAHHPQRANKEAFPFL